MKPLNSFLLLITLFFTPFSLEAQSTITGEEQQPIPVKQSVDLGKPKIEQSGAKTNKVKNITTKPIRPQEERDNLKKRQDELKKINRKAKSAHIKILPSKEQKQLFKILKDIDHRITEIRTHPIKKTKAEIDKINKELEKLNKHVSDIVHKNKPLNNIEKRMLERNIGKTQKLLSLIEFDTSKIYIQVNYEKPTSINVNNQNGNSIQNLNCKGASCSFASHLTCGLWTIVIQSGSCTWTYNVEVNCSMFPWESPTPRITTRSSDCEQVNGPVLSFKN